VVVLGPWVHRCRSFGARTLRKLASAQSLVGAEGKWDWIGNVEQQ